MDTPAVQVTKIQELEELERVKVKNVSLVGTLTEYKVSFKDSKEKLEEMQLKNFGILKAFKILKRNCKVLFVEVICYTNGTKEVTPIPLLDGRGG